MLTSIFFRNNNKEEVPKVTGTEVAIYNAQVSFDLISLFIASHVNETTTSMHDLNKSEKVR